MSRASKRTMAATIRSLRADASPINPTSNAATCWQATTRPTLHERAARGVLAGRRDSAASAPSARAAVAHEVVEGVTAQLVD